MFKVIHLNKAAFSEAVIRKSLYWCSQYAEWILDSNEDQWIINFNTTKDTANVEAHFHRFLNDFSLRETLDNKTKNLRLYIIEKALGSFCAKE